MWQNSIDFIYVTNFFCLIHQIFQQRNSSTYQSWINRLELLLLKICVFEPRVKNYKHHIELRIICEQIVLGKYLMCNEQRILHWIQIVKKSHLSFNMQEQFNKHKHYKGKRWVLLPWHWSWGLFKPFQVITNALKPSPFIITKLQLIQLDAWDLNNGMEPILKPIPNLNMLVPTGWDIQDQHQIFTSGKTTLPTFFA